MRLISMLVVCLGLSACATDYVSQLYEPNHGVRVMQFSEGNVDPAMLMNGVYASKQMDGFSVSNPLGAYCVTNYRCSQAVPRSGWDP